MSPPPLLHARRTPLLDTPPASLSLADTRIRRRTQARSPLDQDRTNPQGTPQDRSFHSDTARQVNTGSERSTAQGTRTRAGTAPSRSIGSMGRSNPRRTEWAHPPSEGTRTLRRMAPAPTRSNGNTPPQGMEWTRWIPRGRTPRRHTVLAPWSSLSSICNRPGICEMSRCCPTSQQWDTYPFLYTDTP
jgi:hypothetical protein